MMRTPALQRAEAAFQAGRADEGRKLLHDAAAAGDAAAGYSLAVALAYGQGGDIDLAEAKTHVEAIRDQLPAARMFYRYALAQEWGGQGGWDAAVRDLLEMAKGGDPAAQRETGLLALVYQQDHIALSLLTPAASAGDMPARMAMMRLRRAGGQPWLASTIAQLQRAKHPLAEDLAGAAEREAPLADPVAIDWDGLADILADIPPCPMGETLVADLSARAFERALSPAVCDHVLTSGLKALQPSTIVDEASGQRVHDPHRQSLSMTFAPHMQDLVHVAVERLMANLAGCPPAHSERLNLLFYRPGEQYRPHVDYFAPNDAGGAREIERAGQRVATSLVSLHAATGGGATCFVRFDTRWTGPAGDALTFRNVTDEGAVQPLSLHQGEPVTEGWKALASLWIRDRAT
jgi:prolyl 4-hydroxylase